MQITCDMVTNGMHQLASDGDAPAERVRVVLLGHLYALSPPCLCLLQNVCGQVANVLITQPWPKRALALWGMGLLCTENKHPATTCNNMHKHHCPFAHCAPPCTFGVQSLP